MSPEQVEGLLLACFALPILAYLTWRSWRGRSKLKIYRAVSVTFWGHTLTEESPAEFRERETLPAPPEAHDWLGPVDE